MTLLPQLHWRKIAPLMNRDSEQLISSPWALFFVTVLRAVLIPSKRLSRGVGRGRSTRLVQIMGSFSQSCVSFTILTRRVSQEQGHWLKENQPPWAAILGKSGSFLWGVEKFLSCQRPQDNKGGKWRQVPAPSLSHKGKFLLIAPLPSLDHKHHRARNARLLSWKALSFLIQVPLVTCLEESIYDSKDSP